MLNSLQIKAADSFVACHGYTAAVVRIRNTSAVSIDYRVGGAISTLTAGASVVIDTASSTSEVELRRTDLSATPANVLVDFGITAEESYELSTTAAAAAVAGLGYINAKTDHGAKGDGVIIPGAGTITQGSTSLAVTGASFTTADVGKLIYVYGAGAGGAVIKSTIAAVASSSVVTLASAVITSSAQAAVLYGFDNAASLQSAVDSCSAAGGGVVVVPRGVYLLGSPIAPKSHVTIDGVNAASLATHQNWDLNFDIKHSSGTTLSYPLGWIIDQDVSASKEDHILVERFAVKNMAVDYSVGLIRLGAVDRAGVGGGSISNIIASHVSGSVIDVKNTMHLNVDYVKANGAQLLRVGSSVTQPLPNPGGDPDEWIQPSNSHFSNMYLFQEATASNTLPGIELYNESTSTTQQTVNGVITLSNCQVNAFNGRKPYMLKTAAMTSGSNVLTVTGGNFSATFLGWDIKLRGAGPSGSALVAKIDSVTDANTVVLTVAASTTVTGGRVTWGGIADRVDIWGRNSNNMMGSVNMSSLDLEGRADNAVHVNHAVSVIFETFVIPTTAGGDQPATPPNTNYTISIENSNGVICYSNSEDAKMELDAASCGTGVTAYGVWREAGSWSARPQGAWMNSTTSYFEVHFSRYENSGLVGNGPGSIGFSYPYGRIDLHSNQSSLAMPYQNIAQATHTCLDYHASAMLLCSLEGAQAITLPPTVAAAGCEMLVVRTSATGTKTITPASGLINGAASRTITTQYETLRLRSDGANWYVT